MGGLLGIHLSSNLNFCVRDKHKLTNTLPLKHLQNTQLMNIFDSIKKNMTISSKAYKLSGIVNFFSLVILLFSENKSWEGTACE